MSSRDRTIASLRTAVAEMARAGDLLEAFLARLRCANCGAISGPRADGWRTYLTDDELPVAEHFCPGCAEREFGCA